MKVAVTGAYGVIGQVVSEGLGEEFDVTRIDVVDEAADMDNSHQLDLAAEPGSDAYRRLKDVVEGHDAVVHLAWNTDEETGENFDNNSYAPENRRMFENVYRIAHETGIGKVVMASSIHAAGLPAYSSSGSLEDTPEPYRSVIENREPDPGTENLVPPGENRADSPYGVSKVAMEESGRFHTSPEFQNPESSNFDEPLESVTCIRFGGVNPEDEADEEGEPLYCTVYLSHADCVRLVETVLRKDPSETESRYHQLYGVSDNDGCPYSLENDFGWKPRDNAFQ